jgi:hypothetical protein
MTTAVKILCALAGSLARFGPAGTRRPSGDLAAAAGAERRRPRRTTLETAEPSERGGMRVGLVVQRAARQDVDAFGGGMALGAERADEVGGLRLGALTGPIADQTSAADGENYGSRLPLGA